MVNVVVVDDDRDTVEIFSEFLRMKGVNVVGHGYNGKDAVELYQEHLPDIIITDMKMPEFDGGYAINEIKKLDPDAKIIVVTGYHDYPIDKEKVTGIFYKPYDIDDIIKAINKITA